MAHDTRRSWGLASRAAIAGLESEGCTVYDLEYAPTPAVFRTVMKEGLDGGLVVSASHNPPEWNGLKFVVQGGRGMYPKEFNSFLRSHATIGGLGRIRAGRSEKANATTYISDLVSYAGESSCEGVSIAVDPGGGVASLFVGKIFKSLGGEVRSVNDSPGLFTRDLDPGLADLTLLRQAVVEGDQDIGFAFDCDADRVVVVGDDGETLPPDYTLLLCLNQFLETGVVRDVAVSVDTTSSVEEMVTSHGGRVYYTPVGEANVVQKILKEKCGLGGEGSSGGVIVPDFVLCRDGLLASALISKYLKEKGGLKEALTGIPERFLLRKKFDCGKKVARDIVEKLSNEAANVDRTDGAKIWDDSDTWILVRASNTEDILRVSVEARDRSKARDLMKKYSAKVGKFRRESEQEKPASKPPKRSITR